MMFNSFVLPTAAAAVMTRRLIRNDLKVKVPPATAALLQQQEQVQFLMRQSSKVPEHRPREKLIRKQFYDFIKNDIHQKVFYINAPWNNYKLGLFLHRSQQISHSHRNLLGDPHEFQFQSRFVYSPSSFHRLKQRRVRR